MVRRLRAICIGTAPVGVEIVSVKPRLIHGRINRLLLTPVRAPEFIPGNSAPDKTDLARGFGRQRDLFRILLSKTEGLSQLACLRRPGFQLLADLAKSALATARRTDRELARGADLQDPYLPQQDQIEYLIEQTSDLQDRLQRQLALVAQLQEDAAELQLELEVLVGRRQATHHCLAFDGMRAFSRRLISELLYDVTPPVLHPRLALDVLTERLGNEPHARVFAVALATAPLVARVARVTWLGEEQVEHITAAALLQDCGKLIVQQARAASKHAANGPMAPPRHTRIGAALVGSYRDAPPELASLIAKHHQRLERNGAGQAGASPTPAELLAAASRFERLRVHSADRSTLLTPPELVDQPAMSQLWRETLDGNWNVQLVRKILVQRDGHLECVRIAEQDGCAGHRPNVTLGAA